MQRRSWLASCLLLLAGCSLGSGSLSPALDTDLTVGYKSEKTTDLSAGDAGHAGQGDASTGGAVGKIGGGGDSVALWLSIAGLTVIALAAYPVQRKARLAWNSWRGSSASRSGKGEDWCVKFSKWDS